MAKWIEYTGSGYQLEEMRNAKHGFITENGGGIRFIERTREDHLKEAPLLSVKKYLICQPHPYAKELQQWADTGQPVYWCSKTGGGSGECHEYFPPFAHPDIFEYSFTPFEE